MVGSSALQHQARKAADRDQGKPTQTTCLISHNGTTVKIRRESNKLPWSSIGKRLPLILRGTRNARARRTHGRLWVLSWVWRLSLASRDAVPETNDNCERLVIGRDAPNCYWVVLRLQVAFFRHGLRRFVYALCSVGFAGAVSARAIATPFRIQFVGDIMLDGGPGHIISNEGNPFAFVEKQLLDADVTIGNLECAITHSGHAVEKPYTFLGPEMSLSLLKRYFAGVTIANNHSGDWGKAGLSGQLQLMKKAELPWFGGGANLAQAHQALIVNRSGHRVALLGYNGFQPRSFEATRSGPGTAWLIERDVINDIRRTRTTQQPDIVVLFLHWGTEFDEQPSQAQRVMAQHFIDAGADVIVGAHPHVTQTIEWYHDKPIVYSLGNFMFDYFPSDPPLWTGWIARLTYNDEPKPKLEIIQVELDSAGVPHLAGEKW